MAKTSIQFERFEEGDAFSYITTQSRFDSMEDDLNSGPGTSGLASATIGEGAATYQHLSSPGPSGTSNKGFGSVIISSKSLRTPPGKNSLSRREYPAGAMGSSYLYLEGRFGPYWGRLSKGMTIGEPGGADYGIDFQPALLEDLDIRVGSNYETDSPARYAAGALILFNVPVRQAPADGMAIQIEFQDQEDNWNSLPETERWFINTVPVTATSGWVQQPLSIRAWISRDRAKNAATTLSPTEKQNLIIKAVRVRFVFVDRGGDPYRTSFGSFSLTAIAFRGHQ